MPENQFTLKNATVVTPDRVIEKGVIDIENGRIKQVREQSDSTPEDRNALDLSGKYIFPGFIDLHVHGGGGGSFNSVDPQDHEKARSYHLLCSECLDDPGGWRPCCWTNQCGCYRH